MRYRPLLAGSSRPGNMISRLMKKLLDLRDAIVAWLGEVDWLGNTLRLLLVFGSLGAFFWFGDNYVLNKPNAKLFGEAGRQGVSELIDDIVSLTTDCEELTQAIAIDRLCVSTEGCSLTRTEMVESHERIKDFSKYCADR